MINILSETLLNFIPIVTGRQPKSLRFYLKKGSIFIENWASALIKKALEGMEYYKAKQGFLEVRVTNESGISLYKKLGFEITRTINGYYSDGEDAYVMTKRL